MDINDTLERLNEAMELHIAGNFEDAEPIYQEILATEPDNPDANHLLGLVRNEQDRAREAMALIEKAIGINPNAAPFHHNIAGIYRRVGRLADAQASFRRAISLKPDYGEAYQGLAEMVTFERSDPFYHQVMNQLKSPGLADNVRCYFHFAAGKFLDDIGEYKSAFAHYKSGNAAAKKEFDSAEFRQQVKDTIYVFSQKHVNAMETVGDPSEQPVFIIGMPRSGTSLIEQILASHPSVYGAGELNEMKLVARHAAQISRSGQTYPNCVPGLTGAQYQTLASEYLKLLQPLVPGTFKRVVDKHPLNFQFAGLILLMFPNARIIHTERDPLDTCISCFFQNFTKGQNYSFDLIKLAHFYNDYRRLMEHWDTVFPGRILSFRYEQMLANQEDETRRLLDYCGLDFDPACLDFHKTQRTVKTASFLQVRKPLYKTSQQRWRSYAEHLQEVASILGIEIEVPVTITNTNSIVSG
ncbi:MAG: sulfotransferase [Pseudomonadales bacterium]